MKHSIKNTSETARLLTITLDAADLAPVKQRTLQRLAKKVTVAGFRTGKVPVAIAEKHINQQVLESEVLEDAVNTYALQALEKEAITPLDQPKVDIKKVVPAQELEFTAEFEVIAKIILGNYKKLKTSKQKATITDKDVQEVIERLQRSAATKKSVERAAKNGDEVTIDFVGTDKDGQEVAGATGKDYPLVLGSNSFIPGFEEGLVGAKAGEKLDLALTFPKDYHHKPLTGAKVHFAVTVNEVREVTLPKLDDEFAKQSGAFKTLDELKADIKKELTAQKEREAADKQKDELLEQLVKASTVPTPEVLVQDQVQALERDFVQNLLYRGLTLDQYLEQEGKTKEDWQKTELRDSAVRRVQVGLVLAELSKVEKIEVTHDELETRFAQLLASYGSDPSIAKQLDTPEARRDLANRTLTEKTVDRLVSLNEK